MWQLACELRDDVEAAVRGGSARCDLDFREQITRSSRSTPANIAEGFGHFKPRQFARYLRIARASAMETQSHIHAGAGQHFQAAEVIKLLGKTRRTLAALSRLIRYLEACDTKFDP